MKTLFPWVGNKKFYIDFIKRNLPLDWDEDTYVEPFLGSAVVFRHLQPACKCVLSDKSKYIMEIFTCLKKDPDSIKSAVKKLYQSNTSNLYTQVKSKILQAKSVSKRSAMYWYLLRTSLYSFVVPKVKCEGFTCCYKSTGKPLEFPEVDFDEYVKLFRRENVSLHNKDFEEVINNCSKGHFIFIDPSYMNSKKPSRRIYNTFSQEDHQRLVECILKADKRGCLIMMFNHNHPFLVEKLKSFKQVPVGHVVMRKSRSQFSHYDEVLYMNY